MASEGELWKNQRELITNALKDLPDRLAKITAEETAQQIPRWNSTKLLDIEEEFLQLTFVSILKALFGVQGSAEECSTVQNAITIAANSLQRIWLSPFPESTWLPSKHRRLLAKSLAVLNRFCRSVYERVDPSSPFQTIKANNSVQQGIAEVKSLIVAGHETVAQGLAWTAVLLAKNPAEQKNLHELAVSKAPNFRSRALDFYDEVLRLYPPIWLMARTATEPKTVGTETLPNGGLVLISLFHLHRHSSLSDDANEFFPARKIAGDIPFGFGARACIGRAMAREQAFLALQTILTNGIFRLDSSLPIKPVAGPTLKLGRLSSINFVNGEA